MIVLNIAAGSLEATAFTGFSTAWSHALLSPTGEKKQLVALVASKVEDAGQYLKLTMTDDKQRTWSIQIPMRYVLLVLEETTGTERTIGFRA